MDAAKVHQYMDQFAQIKAKGGRLNPEQRALRAKIREAKLLDRVDASVLVKLPSGDPVWEKYQGCNDYQMHETGALSLLIGGMDADGEWCTGKMVCWPEGRWLKMETELSSVPNPYYADPDQPDPDADPPAGF